MSNGTDGSNGEHPDSAQSGGNGEQGNEEAARTIQRNYRGYKGRREMKGCGMSASGRWRELLKDAQFYNLTAVRSNSEGNDKSRKWSRVGGITARAANNGDEVQDRPHAPKGAYDYWLRKLRAAKSDDGEQSKTMGLEYWLEMVDRKHRYGTNLLKYHKVWSQADTSENFFFWLDHGDGSNEDLEECPREKLESQQLQYLSREERQKYVINVGDDGLLRWDINDEKVTTHAPDGEDNSNNTGVGGQTETNSHGTDDLHNARGILQGAGHAVPLPLAKLIEKNQNKASWIFAIDTQFRIYAGVKQSGAFQHSSFLQGSRVLSAGLISIQDGQLRSISPHSGHYRPTAENFWITAKCLEAEGVDMSQCSVAGSYALLRGTECYRDGVAWVKGVMDSMQGEPSPDAERE